jgi:phosphatidylinositol alpha-1,6-mannosyltransferase
MCFVLQRADWLLSNSDYTRDTLVDLIGVRPERIAVVYPTVDEKRFRPELPCEDLRNSIGLTPGNQLILSVGRLQRRKGFDNVIRALKVLRQQGYDAHYALIGIGEDLEHLRKVARDTGVQEYVHFLGHVSYEDLPRWYSACNIFAMPNRDIDGDTEGFGLVFLEVAASGKPAVAGLAGGTGSAVVDGVTGLRINGENLNEIVQALSHILHNPEEAAAMGRRGRERVIGNFTHIRRVEQLRRLAQQRT